jgi:hypothetical protein
MEQMRKLRDLPDDERVSATKRLALQIRQLRAGTNKEVLAESLANLVTEGDPGLETLQEVATTLAQTLREQPAAAGQDGPYVTLAKSSELCVMDPKIWTRKRPFLRWSAALKMEERQCHERVRITHPA